MRCIVWSKEKFIKVTTILLPILTLLLASTASWFETNFSVIGNSFGKKVLFIIWGGLAGIYFLMYIRELYQLANYHNKFATFTLYLACILFVAAVIIPYHEEMYPFWSKVHIICAFLSPCVLLISLSVFSIALVRRNRKIFFPAVLVLATILALSAAILFSSGFVTSFLEIFVVLSAILFLKFVEKKLRNKNK